MIRVHRLEEDLSVSVSGGAPGEGAAGGALPNIDVPDVRSSVSGATGRETPHTSVGRHGGTGLRL